MLRYKLALVIYFAHWPNDGSECPQIVTPVIFHVVSPKGDTAIHTAASLNCLDALEGLLLHPASRHLIDRSLSRIYNVCQNHFNPLVTNRCNWRFFQATVHCPISDKHFWDITRNGEENEILHEIFRKVLYVVFPATFCVRSRKSISFGTVHV